jgi:hypothetical protein
VTPSTALAPFPERLERSRVLPAARALGCFCAGFFCAELPLRPADPPLDERPPERPFEARAFEPDFEAPDEPRRWDVLVWAMFLSFAGKPVLRSLTRRESD